MRALLSELAGIESRGATAAVPSTQTPAAPERARGARGPAVALADYDAVI
jgi:hypothetical protein